MKQINDRDTDKKINQSQREKILEIADMLHSNAMLDRNHALQYLYELDTILKHLRHKDYVDIISLIEMIVNEHNLPMFVIYFNLLRATKTYFPERKISFLFSEVCI
eukprot:TRINITY_DN10387_c0_g1_i1.p1 TRINITY_DN10387_c0_g1~~TRINITY_DN10387_c0_g1_i1.p1  ORF type:complete len:122 (-),score=13.05 TRINITY_DN10387_c0_g1_i1:137-454(-)